MSYSYPVMSEEEVQNERYSLLEDGVYNFTVTKATGKMSKPKPGKESNPMIELQITVWDGQGREHYIYDYLVGSRNMAWKTKHFCDSVGLSKEYSGGDFNEFMAERKSGKAQIGFQAGKPKEGGGMYKDKNVIEDYVMTDSGAKKAPLAKDQDNEFSDDVPF